MISLDGKKLSGKILNNLKKEIKRRQLKLKLAVVLVGSDSASLSFIKKKQAAAKRISVGFSLYRFGESIAPGRLKEEVKKIVKNSDNSGVVIQLPLPENINTKEILNIVCERKDADVLSEKSFKKFASGRSFVSPPTVGAILYLLKEYKIRLKGKYVVLVGAGRLVGKPLAAWLKLQGVKFSMLDKSTQDISLFTKKADIIISGVGKSNLIKKDMVSDGVIVFDAGTTKKNGKTVGDVDFGSVSKKASYITPVVGGVGPMTVACLLENLVKINE
ncbi:MAG: bifunctional 5,10-methylenetetrahydrofolate dehydrogenase/5,10-methenyltetrahydrofolate cyclohydrolase [Patescibacteria group bacterium]